MCRAPLGCVGSVYIQLVRWWLVVIDDLQSQLVIIGDLHAEVFFGESLFDERT